MKKWVQKSIVIMVAFLTFGLITPTHELWEAFDQNHSNRSAIDSKDTAKVATVPEEVKEIKVVQESINYESLLVNAAKEQSYMKFGTKVGPKISNEFDTLIFPKMEEAISMTLTNLNEDELPALSITEKPSGAYGEKIFNISRLDTGSDLIRFHVRTDKRPQDGFYYNFHYHTDADQFLTHYNLGDIYWAKDTPPKWLS